MGEGCAGEGEKSERVRGVQVRGKSERVRGVQVRGGRVNG